ncbi:MAG: hypothetical protein HY906_19925 [Deltaproteobacteria bacterium]|nr:hypothetical protein [Deltaproteobacteria bacterium]
MLRSIRISFLAGLVALVFAACSGSSNPPDTQDDGGTNGDGPKIQFDGPRDVGPQQDTGTGDDGGTGACVPTGGQAHAAICTNSKPCTCPDDCVKINPTSTTSGGCFAQPSGSGCGTNEAGIMFSATDPGHCYPTAPIAGTFTIPIGTIDTAGGTISITTNINGVSASFTTAAKGWVEHDTTNAEWVINIYNDPFAVGNNVLLTIWIPDAAYNTTTPVSLDGTLATSAMMRIETAVVTGSTISSDTINAFSWDGTMPLTAAPTTTGNVVGSFSSDAILFGYTAEMCGPNSTPC